MPAAVAVRRLVHRLRRDEAAGTFPPGGSSRDAAARCDLGAAGDIPAPMREASATGCEFAASALVGCKFAFLVHGHFISRPRVNSADNVAT